MINIKKLYKTYKSKKGHQTVALNNLNLSLNDRGMCFILGKSGSGKSTLLNILGGLDDYDRGKMQVYDKDFKSFKKQDLDCYRNTYVGFIFQEYNLLEEYDVYENVVIALKLQNKKINDDEVDKVLDSMELLELKHRNINELSGGQKQRVAIARALIKKPQLILADEPTGNLDSKTGLQIMDILKNISKKYLVVVVSHDNELANKYADRIIEIADGVIINDTNVVEEVPTNTKYEVIKSKLPFRDSFKMGFSSLKHKKIRLFFTLLLIVSSLLSFGLSDTLSSLNINQSHIKLMNEDKIKQFEVRTAYIDAESDVKFQYFKDETALKQTGEKLGIELIPAYKIADRHSFQSLVETFNIAKEGGGETSSYEDYIINNFLLESKIITTQNFDKLITDKIIGSLPNTENDIVISDVVADLIIKYGINIKVKDDEDLEAYNEVLYKPHSYEEIIKDHKQLELGGYKKVYITGIIDYDNEYLKKFSQLLNKGDNLTKDEKSEVADYIVRNIPVDIFDKYNKIYANDNFIIRNQSANERIDDLFHSFFFEGRKEFNFMEPTIIKDTITYYNGSEWIETDKLNDDECIVNVAQLQNFDRGKFYDSLREYIDDSRDPRKLIEEYFKNNSEIGKVETVRVRNTSVDGGSYTPNEYIDEIKLKIIGITFNKKDIYSNKVIVSKEKFQNYLVNDLYLVSGVADMESSNQLLSLLNQHTYAEDGLGIQSPFTSLLNRKTMVNVLKIITFYATIFFMVFAVILESNFIFSSINYRKKEIGILRGLGARLIDIIKIFVWEGITLGLIGANIAYAGLLVVASLLNNLFYEHSRVIFTLFNVNLRQLVLLNILVIIVSMISSILPIIKLSKSKPIDIILNK
ncbi:MAG: ATP-binding cassette domain-containing protein [Erysipelotrichaceae bacterium]|nr:ATP-binding cassette domain-containing protein [Erysipelotrichaceae bacterium]